LEVGVFQGLFVSVEESLKLFRQIGKFRLVLGSHSRLEEVRVFINWEVDDLSTKGAPFEIKNL
jgi:hypothetical protein